MRNIKLIIEYDGTRFHGWQKQPTILTVQGELENLISQLLGEEVILFGSGRTDKGVHAKGQVANFHTNSKIPGEKFKYAINNHLPNDIVIRESREVGEEFNSRFSATGKEYRYLIYNSKIRSPILRNYTYHVPYKLHIDKMQKATSYFLGAHDFCSFMASGSSVTDTVRTIHDMCLKNKDNIIDFRVKGNGFLYNMVRIIVGTLIEVGAGKINIDVVLDIIEAKDRTKAGHTAPPQGLYLERVYYD